MFYKLVHGLDKNNLFEEVYYNRKTAYNSFKYMYNYYERSFNKGLINGSYTCILYTIKEPIDYKQEEKNNAQKLNKKTKRRTF